jgi:hypothetical protein
MLLAEALHQFTLPDDWQARAIRALAAGRDVIVQAPTGAGKTFVFEQFYQQYRRSGQAIYTVPTRALANDKYAEWSRKGWRVGITTGDLVLDPEAPLVVATLEAQQNPGRASLYVIDEFQWLGDALRGNHYEGVIMSIPAGTQLLLLSGSVANPGSVAAWLGRLGRVTELIEQRERPVPLDEVDVAPVSRLGQQSLEGFWPRVLAGALRDDLGPILVFAPARRNAESIARACAQIPCPHPMRLSQDQETAAGPDLARLLTQRIAFHHSGLSYAQRAGLIEPLAKAGQLRIVVATLGLSAGINFSLRSVLVTGSQYQAGGFPREVTAAELLQMFGRAGRRGLDEQGFVLVTDRTPRLGQAARATLRRGTPLPWRPLLRALEEGEDIAAACASFRQRLFSDTSPDLGIEATLAIAEPLPCGLRTDTGRARLVRREGQTQDRPTEGPSGFCAPCRWRPDCLTLDPRPSLIWLWNRLGLLDRDLRLTRRGRVMSRFVGPEGLGVIAGIEDERYPLDELLNDVGNLFAGDRFCGSDPQFGGRLAHACSKAFRRFSSEGFLTDGIPVNYGDGAAALIRDFRHRRIVIRDAVTDEVKRGDIDRLLVEWRSLLRQIITAAGAIPAAITVPAEPLEPSSDRKRRREGMTDDAFWQRLAAFKDLAAAELAHHRIDGLPHLPPLTAEQLKTVSHRI